MIIARYILISLLVLQNTYPSTVVSKKRSIDGQCKKNVFNSTFLAHVKEELGKLIVTHSKTLALENIKKASADLYTADLPDSVKGIFISVHNPTKQTAPLSALYIPKIGSKTSYCEILLGASTNILFQRLQLMWKKQHSQECAQWQAMKQKIADLFFKKPYSIIFDRCSDTPDHSDMIKAKIMNIKGAYIKIWAIQAGYGQTSRGVVLIPCRPGEPELELPFSSDQLPEEVFSTRLENVEWSTSTTLPAGLSHDNLS